MAGMVVSASTGVLSSLLSKLSVLLSDQYKQRKGIRRDIELLSCELTNMNAALEKLADMEKLDGQRKVWRDKVREMGYDIEDCIDIFMHQLGQGDDKDGLFHKIACKIRELRLHYQLANMIQDIKARVEEQSKIRERYKIDESISTSRVVVEVDPRLPALFEDAKRLVGIRGPREKICKLLKGEGGSNSGQLKVVSIVGFGGLGKTTLANQVHTKLKSTFECSTFVSVSRTPDMSKILKDILSGVGFDCKEMEDDVQKLINTLRVGLANKRYLIIIDDLWSIKDWHTIKCSFVGNNNGSRVITTTRNQDIAAACCFPSQEHVYHMQPLNEIHSRRLFFKRIFDTEDACPEQFIEISKHMLRKCKGVPLAITSIASLLSNHMHVDTWEKIHNSLGSELDTNPTLEWMKHVLSLSYNDLSHELKTCLLYLGMYPEDYKIRKFDLMRKWTAEGFVREKHGLDMEEAAENCFNELINRSMIQPCFGMIQPCFSGMGSRQVWACQVHDLMLDLIISKCNEENFITIIDRSLTVNGASQVRRMSHQFNHEDMALTVERMSPSQIRSFNSFCAADFMPPLSKFDLLRVLDMNQGFSPGPESIPFDLSAINHLFLLRYVRVAGFCLELPKKFGNLKHLITLDMEGAILHSGNQISDFTSLSSLRHLTLPRKQKQQRVVLKNGLSKLCNLRTLSNFCIWTNSLECIRDLGGLNNLRDLFVIYSRPRHVEEDNPNIKILAASLDKLGKNRLSSLKFEGEGTSVSWVHYEQFWSNCFTHLRHLQSLVLCSLTIPKVPNWMAHANRLEYLDPLNVKELRSDDIHILGQLPCLIYLWLKATQFPEKNIIIQPNSFPCLEHFHFSACEVSCLAFQPLAMPRLQKLDIRLYYGEQSAIHLKEGSLVCGIEHLASVERIIVMGMTAHGSQIETAWREAINRHPKRQALEIAVKCFDNKKKK